MKKLTIIFLLFFLSSCAKPSLEKLEIQRLNIKSINCNCDIFNNCECSIVLKQIEEYNKFQIEDYISLRLNSNCEFEYYD